MHRVLGASRQECDVHAETTRAVALMLRLISADIEHNAAYQQWLVAAGLAHHLMLCMLGFTRKKTG